MTTDIDILRFTTVGSVDDGKSTLIGRLLYDSKSIFEDQLEAIKKTSAKAGSNKVDLALLTDGLAAEREQGITIDVAYRYFNTPKRKFIIADTPGHVEYTRNMVTGASTANLTIILVDARKGILDQSRRHAFISALLGIPKFIIAINKMDLVNYSEEIFNNIKNDFIEMLYKIGISEDKVEFVPISALEGTNVVNHETLDDSGELVNFTPWYTGKTVMDILENTRSDNYINQEHFRLPIQRVIRVDNTENYSDFRGFAGQIQSGSIKIGDTITALPSGKTSKVKSIHLFDKTLREAIALQSVIISLEDEIDISRGDMVVKDTDSINLIKDFDADICWMSEDAFKPRKKYLLKHTSQILKAMPVEINHKYDIHTYERCDATSLELNELASVKFKLLKEIPVDSYKNNRGTGSFILIDEVTNQTVAAGMITKN